MFKRKSLSSHSNEVPSSTSTNNSSSPSNFSSDSSDIFKRSSSIAAISTGHHHHTDSSVSTPTTSTTNISEGNGSKTPRGSVLSITSSAQVVGNNGNISPNSSTISAVDVGSNVQQQSTIKERKKSLSSLKNILTPRKFGGSSNSMDNHDVLSTSSNGIEMGEHKRGMSMHRKGSSSSGFSGSLGSSSMLSMGGLPSTSGSTKVPLHLLFAKNQQVSSDDFSESDDLSEIGTDVSLDDHDLKELKDSIQGFEREMQQLSPRVSTESEKLDVPKATINMTPSSPNTTGRNRAISEASQQKKKREQEREKEMDVLSFLHDMEEETKKKEDPKKGRNRFNTLTERLKKAYYDHKKKEEDEESDGDSDDGDSSAVGTYGGKSINVLGQLEEEYKGMNSTQVIEAEKERREQERIFSPLVILRQFEREKKLAAKYKVVNVYFEKVTFM